MIIKLPAHKEKAAVGALSELYIVDVQIEELYWLLLSSDPAADSRRHKPLTLAGCSAADGELAFDVFIPISIVIINYVKTAEK